MYELWLIDLITLPNADKINDETWSQYFQCKACTDEAWKLWFMLDA